MRTYRPLTPPEVAELIRRLHPDLKRSITNALRALSDDPSTGEPLRRELTGLWKYRVRRFRIVYAVDRQRRIIRVVGGERRPRAAAHRPGRAPHQRPEGHGDAREWSIAAAPRVDHGDRDGGRRRRHAGDDDRLAAAHRPAPPVESKSGP